MNGTTSVECVVQTDMYVCVLCGKMQILNAGVHTQMTEVEKEKWFWGGGVSYCTLIWNIYIYMKDRIQICLLYCIGSMDAKDWSAICKVP